MNTQQPEQVQQYYWFLVDKIIKSTKCARSGNIKVAEK